LGEAPRWKKKKPEEGSHRRAESVNALMFPNIVSEKREGSWRMK